MAGYSGTPLPRKLGIKAGHRIVLLKAPAGFNKLLDPLPGDIEIRTDLRGRGGFDVIVFFVKRRAELERDFARISGRLDDAGGLWVSWPKKASGVATDVTESVVREVGLDAGLVDNKICAVDETWSGLRFVIRVADRGRG